MSRTNSDSFKLDLIIIIIFWTGISGFINTWITWYLDVTDWHDNYRIKLLIYSLIAAIGLGILFFFFDEDCKDDHKSDDTETDETETEDDSCSNH